MNNIAFIDIEASGLHFDSYPIEIAVLKGDEIRSWLIKPEATWQYWSETAEQMHGISREILIKDGISCNTVVEQLNEFLLDFDGVLYSDAYQWDIDWVDTLYFSVKQKNHFTSLLFMSFCLIKKLNNLMNLNWHWLNLVVIESIVQGMMWVLLLKHFSLCCHLNVYGSYKISKRDCRSAVCRG